MGNSFNIKTPIVSVEEVAQKGMILLMVPLD
jgi:hypothetical protein